MARTFGLAVIAVVLLGTAALLPSSQAHHNAVQTIDLQFDSFGNTNWTPDFYGNGIPCNHPRPGYDDPSILMVYCELGCGEDHAILVGAEGFGTVEGWAGCQSGDFADGSFAHCTGVADSYAWTNKFLILGDPLGLQGFINILPLECQATNVGTLNPDWVSGCAVRVDDLVTDWGVSCTIEVRH